MTPATLAEAAETFVGTRFRLHGRNPATGLDCIGLFSASMTQAGSACPVPTGYPMRVLDLAQWLPDPAIFGLLDAEPPFQPGDVAMLRPSVGQFHLAIAGRFGWVHAHAGLRRVVRQPDLPSGDLVHHWRLIPPT